MSNLKLETQRRLYNYAKNIVLFTIKLDNKPASQIIGKQLLRSGTSVSANMIEAQAASSKKDFTNFFHYALKSANESKLWLALIRDTMPDLKEEAERLLSETVEISKILAASILTMKKLR